MAPCSVARAPTSAPAMSRLTLETALATPLPPQASPPSRSSVASNSPVEAPEGTAARPLASESSVTSTSTVGFPRESRIWRAWMRSIVGISNGVRARPRTELLVRASRSRRGSLSRPTCPRPARATAQRSCERRDALGSVLSLRSHRVLLPTRSCCARSKTPGRERLLWVRRAFVPFRDVFERGRERVCEERELAERPFAEREWSKLSRSRLSTTRARGVRVFAWAIVTASLWSDPMYRY